MKTKSKFQGSTASISLFFVLAAATVGGCKAKQSDSSVKEFQAKVGSGLGALQLIGLDPADGKVKIRACSTEEQKQAILTASDEIVDGILPVDFTKCPTKATDDTGKVFKELSLEEYKSKLAVHLGARDFSSDEFIIAGAYLDLEALIRSFGKKEYIDGLGQLDTNRSDIDSLILQPGAVLDDIKEDGDYAQRAEQSYNDQLSKLAQFKKYRVREKDQAMYNKVVARLESTLTAQKNNWAQTQTYKYILLHVESKFAMRGDGDRNAKLISSQGELYKSAVSPLKNHPELREPKGVLTAHRICRELDGTVATTQELSEAGFLANLSGDAILTGDEAGFRDSSINVTLYNPSTKKIEIREVANIDAGKDKSAFRYACSTSRKQSLDSGNAKLCYLAFAYELNRGDAYFASTDKWINFAEPKPTAEAIKAAEVKKEAYKKQFWDPSLVEISECQAEYERFSAKSTNCKIVYDAKLDWYSIYKDGTLHVDERWNKYGGSSNGGRSNPYAEKFLAVLQKEGTCNSRSVALSEYRIYAPIFSEVLVEEKTAAVDSDGCKCGLTDSLPKMCIVFKGKVTFSGFLCPLGTTTCCTQDICSNLVAKSKMEGRTIWTEPTECNGKAVLRQ